MEQKHRLRWNSMASWKMMVDSWLGLVVGLYSGQRKILYSSYAGREIKMVTLMKECSIPAFSIVRLRLVLDLR